MRKVRNLFVAAALAALALPAGAAVVYFCDEQGNVGAYDDATGIVSPVGDLSAFQVEQVVGLAWDPGSGRILLLDRNAPAVYAMDPATGNATLLFDPGFIFQGGAVVGNALYGIDESGQTVEAFDLGTFADLGLSAAPIVGHHHGLGVDPETGQLYIGGSLTEALRPGGIDGGEGAAEGLDSDEIATILPNGSYGVQRVTFSENVEDIDYYGPHFLMAPYTQEILHVDGTTGALSVWLDSVQIASAGVGLTTGVAVAGFTYPTLVDVPTLGRRELGLLAVALALAGGLLLRRRQSRTA